MSTPLFSFSNSPKSIPVSMNTSWPASPVAAAATVSVTVSAAATVPVSNAPKYNISPQNDGQLTLRPTMSHMPRAYKDAEPFMDKCRQGEAVLINWHVTPTYHYPPWRNYLYEPHVDVTYCYLRKYDDNIFHEYNVYSQAYDTVQPVWDYCVSPLPTKKEMFYYDRYTTPRAILRWTIPLLIIFIVLCLCF